MFLTGAGVRGIGDLSGIGGLGGVDVAKAEWGTKCMCQTCGAKFYDLKKSPVLCPSCGELYLAKPAKAAPAPKVVKPVKAEPPPAPPPSMDDDDAEPEKPAKEEDLAKDINADESDDNDEDAPIEDVSELGGDRDEVAEVIETEVEKVVVKR